VNWSLELAGRLSAVRRVDCYCRFDPVSLIVSASIIVQARITPQELPDSFGVAGGTMRGRGGYWSQTRIFGAGPRAIAISECRLSSRERSARTISLASPKWWVLAMLGGSDSGGRKRPEMGKAMVNRCLHTLSVSIWREGEPRVVSHAIIDS
jgi:hypothetical protein